MTDSYRPGERRCLHGCVLPCATGDEAEDRAAETSHWLRRHGLPPSAVHMLSVIAMEPDWAYPHELANAAGCAADLAALDLAALESRYLIARAKDPVTHRSMYRITTRGQQLQRSGVS